MRFTNHAVTSKDGTRVGYQSIGHGTGIIFVQGTLGTIENFTQLAQELADSFTIYLAERRGRGISPKVFTGDHSIERDVEDIAALLEATDAKYIFGLSSGGIITLQAALEFPAIRKIAVYEPPLMVDGIPKSLERFKKDIDNGKTADALVTAMKASEMGPSFMNHIPDWLLVFLTNILLGQEDKKAKNGVVRYWHDVAPTLQFDFKVIEEANPNWQTFKNVQMEVLLLGGSKSPKYLTNALDSLERVLPKSTRLEFEGLDHGAAWNYHKRQNPHGDPKLVAEKLREFFN
jgi:pimeloyl-ACP methyl ester carboxylesterase